MVHSYVVVLFLRTSSSFGHSPRLPVGEHHLEKSRGAQSVEIEKGAHLFSSDFDNFLLKRLF